MTPDKVIPRRRFYSIAPNSSRNPSDYAFTNEDEALIDRCWAGKHKHPMPPPMHPRSFGVPTLRTRSRLIVACKNKPLDFYGFTAVFVSGRAKRLLESIDPQGFEFAQCDAVTGKGMPIEPYWMMAVVRVVDDFDRARSNFETYSERNPQAPDALINPMIQRLNDIYLNKDFPFNAHTLALDSKSF